MSNAVRMDARVVDASFMKHSHSVRRFGAISIEVELFVLADPVRICLELLRQYGGDAEGRKRRQPKHRLAVRLAHPVRGGRG